MKNDHLVHFLRFGMFGPRKIWQPCYALSLTKMGWAPFWPIVFSNLSGHTEENTATVKTNVSERDQLSLK
jgi:hypothetical protein